LCPIKLEEVQEVVLSECRPYFHDQGCVDRILQICGSRGGLGEILFQEEVNLECSALIADKRFSHLNMYAKFTQKHTVNAFFV
jgi:hypothetical protein